MGIGASADIVQTPGGASVRKDGRWLLSSRAPRELPERSASLFECKERSLVLCPSPLLGYGLGLLLAKLPPSSLLLCVEAEPALLALSRTAIPEALRSHPRFRLSSPEGVEAALEGQGPFRRVQYLELTGGASLAADRYASLRDGLVSRIAAGWRNRATLWKLGRLYVRNLVANLPRLPQALSPAELLAPARGKTIVVAGAGPSLEDALPYLSRCREGLFVIAVDTALPVLAQAGIRPDAAVCIEAQVHNLADFIGLSASGIPLVADLVSHPASFRGLGGGVCPLASSFDDLAFLSRLRSGKVLPPRFPALGSVGVAAAAFALREGPADSPLLVTGLDFSYQAGKTHARGSPAASAWLRSRARLAPDGQWDASTSARSRVLEGLPPAEGMAQRGDSVLSGYASLCAEALASESRRCLDIRGRGIGLGIARADIAGLPDGRALFALLPRPDDDSRQTPQPAWTPPTATAVRDALEEELELVRRLRAGLSGSLNLAEGELRGLLESCDELSLHFPDAEEGPRLDLDYLKRVALEAEGMIPRLERAAQSC